MTDKEIDDVADQTEAENQAGGRGAEANPAASAREGVARTGAAQEGSAGQGFRLDGETQEQGRARTAAAEQQDEAAADPPGTGQFTGANSR